MRTNSHLQKRPGQDAPAGINKKGIDKHYTIKKSQKQTTTHTKIKKNESRDLNLYTGGAVSDYILQGTLEDIVSHRALVIFCNENKLCNLE